MKTQVIMKRPLFGIEISQQSKTEFFSATDMVKAGNIWRKDNGMKPFKLIDWKNTKSNKEFMSELEKKYGDIYKPARGRGQHTWVHPLLFIDIALSISPKLKIETYEWLFDHLIKNRNDSGNSYKKMCGSLYVRQSNKSTFHKDIQILAKSIKTICNVTDWNSATEEQLKRRDRIHEDISLLSDVLNNNGEAIRIALKRNS